MKGNTLKLGVNVDHVATLREARGTNYPAPVDAARRCIQAGAYGITIHLREDRRHINDADVYTIHRDISAPLNLEMGNSPDIVAIALDVVPEEVCLVPERRQELTTEGGLNVAGEVMSLAPTVESLIAAGVDVSLFIDPQIDQIEASAQLGVQHIELHTGSYCDAGKAQRAIELDKLITAAYAAHALGLGVNAGHGINLDNIAGILQIPHLEILNIGHSIVARAVFVGMKTAVQEMLTAISGYHENPS